MNPVTSDWSKVGLATVSHLSRRRRGCRRRLFGCFTMLLLLLLLACALIFWLFQSRPAQAQTEPEPSPVPLSVYLLVDQSRSLSSPHGPATDPQGWRLTAARLFVSFLGINQAPGAHQCGLIFFGGDAEIAVPLATLDRAHRQTLFAALEEPSPVEWTDQTAALALARAQVENGAPAGRPVFVLITDGRPEWSGTPTEVERAAYLARLQKEGERLAAAQIPLFTILLAPGDEAETEEMSQTWIPQWRALSQQVPPGRFYVARKTTDLATIYRQIAISLTKQQTAGAIIQGTMPAEPWQRDFLVPPTWTQMTLMLSKTPGQIVTLVQPDGIPLASDGAIRRASVGESTLWVIPEPLPGTWTLRGEGAGAIIVWQDYRPAPPQPTSTYLPTPTPQPSATPSRPSPTFTPMPVASPSPLPPTLRPAKTAAAPSIPATASSTSSDLIGLLILGGLGVLLVGGSAGLYHWRAQRRPLVQGEIQILKGAGTPDGQTTISLDLLQQETVTIGAAPADVILIGATEQIEIRTGQAIGAQPEMLVSGPDTITVNGYSLGSAVRLGDEDLIQIGSHLLRYENLRWRSAARSAAWRT